MLAGTDVLWAAPGPSMYAGDRKRGCRLGTNFAHRKKHLCGDGVEVTALPYNL